MQAFNPISGNRFGEKTSARLAESGFTDPRWVTREQANRLGGYVDTYIRLKRGNVKRPTEKNSIPIQSGVPRNATGVLVKFALPFNPPRFKPDGSEDRFLRVIEYFNLEVCFGVVEGAHLYRFNEDGELVLGKLEGRCRIKVAR
jgi:hypothetical protein